MIDKYKCKKINISHNNNNTNIIAIKSNHLNLNIKFYTTAHQKIHVMKNYL